MDLKVFVKAFTLAVIKIFNKSYCEKKTFLIKSIKK